MAGRTQSRMGRSSSRPGTYVSYKLVKNSAQVINHTKKCAGKSLDKEGQKRLTYQKPPVSAMQDVEEFLRGNYVGD